MYSSYTSILFYQINHLPFWHAHHIISLHPEITFIFLHNSVWLLRLTDIQRAQHLFFSGVHNSISGVNHLHLLVKFHLDVFRHVIDMFLDLCLTYWLQEVWFLQLQLIVNCDSVDFHTMSLFSQHFLNYDLVFRLSLHSERHSLSYYVCDFLIVCWYFWQFNLFLLLFV